MNNVLVVSALGLLALGAPAMSPLTMTDGDRSGGLQAPRPISHRTEEWQAPLSEEEIQAPYAVAQREEDIKAPLAECGAEAPYQVAQREDIQAPLIEGDAATPFVVAQREEELQAPLADHGLPVAGERRARETPRLV